MELFQTKHAVSPNKESNLESCTHPHVPVEQIHPTKRLLCYARKLFPVNVFVNIVGRRGIYRVVSEPYIPPGYSYPHFDVEAFGERFCASVFEAAPILETGALR